MEGGNRAVNPARTEVHTVDSLALLSTGNDANRPLVAFDGTSAASALAARLAARLYADHPEYWPETIRALMVHSAEWTPRMLALFTASANNRRERYALVRRFGYGVPEYNRATASATNHMALFSQTELQPFKMEGGRTFGDCHYYRLPIPRHMLEELANEIVELKITLSYFIDPNPGLSANTDPQRYQSHGLRFDLKRKAETLDVFKRRVNAEERDDPRVGPQREDDDGRWLLGPKSVSAGSLHCDVWTGPAIELAGRDTLCIKPVVGWTRKRSKPEICNTMRRYSLIITIKARNSDIDLYTPISALIPIEAAIAVEIGDAF
jgi:Subtilase family